MPLVSRRNMCCILEACGYHRLSAAEPAGSTWEKQPGRKDMMVAPEEDGAALDAVAWPGTARETAQGEHRASSASTTNGRLTLVAHLPAKPSGGFPEACGIAQIHHFVAKAQMK